MMMNNDNSSVVISSRVRLARNVKQLPFPHLLNDEHAYELMKKVDELITKQYGLQFLLISSLSDIDKGVLVEDYHASLDLINNTRNGAVITNKKDLSVMLNEEDHIRLQCIEDGLNLDKTYNSLQEIDNLINSNLPIAYDNKLGFLTSCLTNVGTGMRASVMMFLPGLTISGQMNNIISQLNSMRLTVRGNHGEGSSASGYTYQISNQVTLGVSEQEIIEVVTSAVQQIVIAEQQARQTIYNSDVVGVTDKLMRWYGILTHAYKLSLEEFNKYFVAVRLLLAYNAINITADMAKLNRLCSQAQTMHIASKYNLDINDSARIDMARAEFVKENIREK